MPARRLCLLCDHQEPGKTQAGEGNEGYVLIRRVSALLWKYFEPELPYLPPAELGNIYPNDGVNIRTQGEFVLTGHMN